MNLESRTPKRKLPTAVFVAAVAGLLAAGYILAPRFEREAPVITLTPDASVVGQGPIEIGITDRGIGLKSVTATLSAGGKDHEIAVEAYATVGSIEIRRELTSTAQNRSMNGS